MKKKVKALALVSGGLDSTLALALIREQGIEVEALNFSTGFCFTAHHRAMASPRHKLRNEALRAWIDTEQERLSEAGRLKIDSSLVIGS